MNKDNGRTTCAILVPRIDLGMGFGFEADHCKTECIRSDAHLGPHVFSTDQGDFIAWEDDYSCGCCAPEEPDRCFDFWTLSRAELDALAIIPRLNRESPNRDKGDHDDETRQHLLPRELPSGRTSPPPTGAPNA